MTHHHDLIRRMATELDHYRQLLTDDRREVHPLAVEARAVLAASVTSPPDWRGLCEELAEALDGWHQAVFETGVGWVRPDETYLLDRARAALSQPEPEVGGPTDGSGKEWQWYTYCPEEGIELYPDSQQAQSAARSIMGSCEVAAHSDGWHEDMELVSWGMLVPVEQAQVVARGPADPDGEFDEWVRYELRAAPSHGRPAPAPDFRAELQRLVDAADEYVSSSATDDEFFEAKERARAALAQAEPKVVELTDEELFRIASDSHALYIADDRDCDNCSEVVAAMRAAITADRARWGRPAPAPAGEVRHAASVRRMCDIVLGNTFGNEELDSLALLVGHYPDALNVSPAPAGEVAELVAWLRNMAEAGLGGLDELNADRAAELLEQRQAAPVPAAPREVAELVPWLLEEAVQAANSDAPRSAGMLTWAAQVVGEHADLLERQAAPVPDCERNWDSLLSPSGGYEMADDAALRDGAQLINGEWWAPVFGCDSLQAALDRIRERLERQAAPVPVASDVYFEFVVSDADYCTQAGGIAPTYAQAVSEGQNYLAQYQQDGPHTLEVRRVEVLPLPSVEVEA